MNECLAEGEGEREGEDTNTIDVSVASDRGLPLISLRCNWLRHQLFDRGSSLLVRASGLNLKGDQFNPQPVGKWAREVLEHCSPMPTSVAEKLLISEFPSQEQQYSTQYLYIAVSWFHVNPLNLVPASCEAHVRVMLLRSM